MKQLLPVLLLLLCSAGCNELVTVPIKTAGDLGTATISAAGKVTAETVKTTGTLAGKVIENPDGAAAATTLIP